MTKERKFYDALKDIFVGAKIEGESGYINLMKIKSRYYEGGVFPKLKQDIEDALKPFPDFREELFDKLYTFFSRYFSESGSIYFRYTPLHQNIYERVYTDDKDVMLFWKTYMLYYVKTDRLFRNLEVEIDGVKFFFDVSTLEHKRANEKREIIYEFKEKRGDGTLVFVVAYSERGQKTKLDEIQRALKREGVKVEEETLERAFRVFERQSEVDYFINKNAKAFLQEQFNLWLYQYVFSGVAEVTETSAFMSDWTEKRIKQLQALKGIAYKIIDFISQFEDELVKIWNKPKFALNSNYVITLDRIAERDMRLVERLLDHENFQEQVEEWQALGIVDSDFNKEAVGERGSCRVIKQDLLGKHLSDAYRYLPIDTRYFKDLELDILGLFDNLDKALDGWLIKSENYQALNTILPKFRERVQTIYIDPPFNLGTNADFFYSVKYKDASWVTLLENRLRLACDLLSSQGSIFIRCDYNGNMFIRLLLSEILGEDNFGNEIIINRFRRQLDELTRFNVATDSLFYFTKTKKPFFSTPYRKRICSFCGQEIEPNWRPMSSPGLRHPPERVILGRELLPPKGRHWTFTQQKIEQMEMDGRIRINESITYTDLEGNRIQGLPEYLQTEETPVDSVWTDLKGYVFGSTFPTENPEELLKRVIEVSSLQQTIVMDFFLGSGTTTATAHKLGRRWLGVEMGEHFYDVILPRMKKVLAGEQSGISKEANWQGSGFFKYYQLEQYENTLRKAKYEDSDLFENPYQEPYNQYVFLRDLKMLEALAVDLKQDKVRVELSKLYEDIDIAETFSNLTGKWIKKIKADCVEFEDGETLDLKNLDWRRIKPLIWW
ncbi:site-specific DNA-methyltransferase [Candidatus Poribacteria bacterium]|nr:site-specific DNA-methyltransferase [Candidatus Poribacteria bacterium]